MSSRPLSVILSAFSLRAVRLLLVVSFGTSLLLGLVSTFVFVQKRDEAVLQGAHLYIRQLLAVNDTIEISRHLHSFFDPGLMNHFELREVNTGRVVAQSQNDLSQLGRGVLVWNDGSLLWTRRAYFHAGVNRYVLLAWFDLPLSFVGGALLAGFCWALFSVLIFLAQSKGALHRLNEDILGLQALIQNFSKTQMNSHQFQMRELEQTFQTFADVYHRLEVAEAAKREGIRNTVMAELARQLIHDI